MLLFELFQVKFRLRKIADLHNISKIQKMLRLKIQPGFSYALDLYPVNIPAAFALDDLFQLFPQFLFGRMTF